MRIATLGPKGTYSVQAAQHYQPSAELVLCNTIAGVVSQLAEGRAEIGIIPIENSIHGIVAETLDSLSESNLLIVDELIVDIYHALCGVDPNINPEQVQKIYSHPQALRQCSKYILRFYPQAELIETTSTAAAIKAVVNLKDKTALAIGSEAAADEYGLHIIDNSIEDEKNNQTRFVVISKDSSGKKLPFIIACLAPEYDRPGLLHDILSIIKEEGVNLLQIDSRPNRRQLGAYIFYIRLDLNSDDPRFNKIINEVKKARVTVKRMSA